MTPATWPQIIISLISAGMIGGGFLLMWRTSNYSNNAVNQRVIEVLGLSFILPVILLLAVFTEVKMEAITGILGGLIGYVFGTYKSRSDNQSKE